jgi:hypothetical protein
VVCGDLIGLEEKSGIIISTLRPSVVLLKLSEAKSKKIEHSNDLAGTFWANAERRRKSHRRKSLLMWFMVAVAASLVGVLIVLALSNFS